MKQKLALEKSFQFHIGAIRSCCILRSPLLSLARFNSILVQLEGLSRHGISSSRPLFQFHIGAIRSEQSKLAELQSKLAFQFHIGAIRRRLCRHSNNTVDRVSIPYWCN